MMSLRLTRWLRAAIPALAMSVLMASPVSAGFVTSGNTHPDHLSSGTPGGIVAVAVYQLVAGSFGTGSAALEAKVGTWGAPGEYLYLYSTLSTSTVGPPPFAITGTGINVFGIGGDVVTFGETNSTGLVFGNLFAPALPGTDQAAYNSLGVLPTFITPGGLTPITTVFASSNALTAFTLAPALAPGLTTNIWGYTSSYAPIPIGLGIQAGTTADGFTLGGSQIPEPATVAMFATAIPFGLLYLKRRKAAQTV